jgi:hypothetical protein
MAWYIAASVVGAVIGAALMFVGLLIYFVITFSDWGP